MRKFEGYFGYFFWFYRAEPKPKFRKNKACKITDKI